MALCTPEVLLELAFQCFCAHVPSDITTSRVTQSGVITSDREGPSSGTGSAANGLDPVIRTPNPAKRGEGRCFQSVWCGDVALGGWKFVSLFEGRRDSGVSPLALLVLQPHIFT